MQNTTEPTVFIVDDDPDFLTALALMLESTGLRVETFPGAQDFLAAYTPDRPGCLITDVRLRGMSGLTLLERLGGRAAPLPVLLVTGYGDFQMAVRAFKEGATDIFQKPFEDQDVIDRVWQLIRDDKATRTARTEKNEVSARLKLLTPARARRPGAASQRPRLERDGGRAELEHPHRREPSRPDPREAGRRISDAGCPSRPARPRPTVSDSYGCRGTANSPIKAWSRSTATGLVRWKWKPAASARCLSSLRP